MFQTHSYSLLVNTNEFMFGFKVVEATDALSEFRVSCIILSFYNANEQVYIKNTCFSDRDQGFNVLWGAVYNGVQWGNMGYYGLLWTMDYGPWTMYRVLCSMYYVNHAQKQQNFLTAKNISKINV